MKTVKELKKQSRKNDNTSLLLVALIYIITILFSLGNSALNQKLNISGEAVYRVMADMRITHLSEPTRVNGGDITYNGTYSVNSVSLHVELPNKDSSVEYVVKITNIGNINQWIKSINATSNNENIIYKIENLKPQEDIIYSPNSSENNIKEIKIIFSYNDSIKNGVQALPTGDGTRLSTIISFEYEILETYLVTYDLDGGSVASNPPNYTKSDTITLNNPTKKGYEFLGWTGTGLDAVTKNVTIPKLSEGDRNYVANWQIKTYKLTINPNGGTYNGNSSATISDILYNNSININVPIRTGYVFNGWEVSNKNSNLSGTTFTMGDGDTTLTANWERISYTISYDCNGGNGTTSSSTHEYDVAKKLTANGCSKIQTGSAGTIYSFLGWAESANAITPKYSNKENVSNLTMEHGATITLYAVWTNTSIFTYNGSYNVLDDGNGNWRIKLLSNGTYTSNFATSIDAFLVGGGGGGGASSDEKVAPNYMGSGGGGGGYTKTQKNILLNTASYTITIGNGGGSGAAGGTTSAFNYEALGGQPGITEGSGGAGGSGGGAGGYSYNLAPGKGGEYGNSGKNMQSSSSSQSLSFGGSGQNFTTCEFGQGTTSGCNSGVTNYASGGTGGSGRGNGSHATAGDGNGYTTANLSGISAGAGSGGKKSNGGNATANTGSGGGGASFHYGKYNVFGTYVGSTITTYTGGTGGSGIVVIRNAR